MDQNAREGQDCGNDKDLGADEDYGLRKESYGSGFTSTNPCLHDNGAVGASTLACDVGSGTPCYLSLLRPEQGDKIGK